MSERARVFLACPRYGPVAFEAVLAATQATQEHDVALWSHEDSRLPYCFNKLWCGALNTRATHHWTHFAMLHSDVIPEHGWLDMLIAEQQRVGVQVLAAVIPIKDERGLTSTGVWDVSRGVIRLTMTEVFELPTTFTRADVLCQDMPLVVNTGCWVCDFTQPWVEQVRFHFSDQIVHVPDGSFEARTLSEDWNFSLQLASLGVSVAATRVVPLTHAGSWSFRNDHAWGNWKHDEGGH